MLGKLEKAGIRRWGLSCLKLHRGLAQLFLEMLVNGIFLSHCPILWVEIV